MERRLSENDRGNELSVWESEEWAETLTQTWVYIRFCSPRHHLVAFNHSCLSSVKIMRNVFYETERQIIWWSLDFEGWRSRPAVCWCVSTHDPHQLRLRGFLALISLWKMTTNCSYEWGSTFFRGQRTAVHSWVSWRVPTTNGALHFIPVMWMEMLICIKCHHQVHLIQLQVHVVAAGVVSQSHVPLEQRMLAVIGWEKNSRNSFS